jgi:hypothetical protein
MSRLSPRVVFPVALVVLAAAIANPLRSIAQPVARRPVTAPPANPGGGTLTEQSENMLKERNLHTPVYNGVKFLALVAQGKINQADAVFLTRDNTRGLLTEGRTLELLRLMDLRPPFTIQCVGFNQISLDALTLLYVGTTEHGPAGVKLYIYKHEKELYIGRVDITFDWTELEHMTETVVRLPAPLVINVAPSKDETGGGDVQGAK